MYSYSYSHLEAISIHKSNHKDVFLDSEDSVKGRYPCEARALITATLYSSLYKDQ